MLGNPRAPACIASEWSANGKLSRNGVRGNSGLERRSPHDSPKPTSGQRRRQFVPAGIRSGLPVIRSLFSELDLGKKSPNHRINHFWLYCVVLEQTLNLDRVGDLLKLQKVAQKISPILDLDQLVDKVVRSEERRVGKECRARWSRY